MGVELEIILLQLDREVAKRRVFMLEEVIRGSNQVRPKAAEWLSSFRAAVSIFDSFHFPVEV